MTKRSRVFFAVALATSVWPLGAAGAAQSNGTATAPGAPTITAATAGNRSLTIAFTAPISNGGAAILRYRAICRPLGGGETKTAYNRRSPIVVSGVPANRSYSCVVAARNRIGFGPASAPFTAKATGPSCASGSGTATFSPALPRLGSKALVDTVLTLNGTISDCHGGGVTSGKATAASSPSSGSNCTTTIAKVPVPLPPATLTITWNTNATSTIALTIAVVPGNFTRTTLTGTVTAGLFRGLGVTGLLSYTIPTGGCTALDLASLTYTEIIPLVFG